MHMKTLQDRVKYARQQASMTQVELSAASGLSQSTIAQIESGRNDSTRLGPPLAKALGVGLGWLLTGEGVMSIEARVTADGSTVPATAGTQEAPCVMPSLYSHEVYAGVVSHRGAKMHLILLQGAARVVGADAAEEFAASVGGELPTYAELAYLGDLMPQRFKPGLYYTCDQEEYDGDMATALWACGLAEGTSVTRVRAVRRVPAERATTGPGLTGQQVADLAKRLIDQASPNNQNDMSDDEHLVGAGIKVGIGRMAMEVQTLLAMGSRHLGAANE